MPVLAISQRLLIKFRTKDLLKNNNNKKLKSHDIVNYVLNWIKDWLRGRKQKVVIDGCESGYMNVLSGVPQGSVLGLETMSLREMCPQLKLPINIMKGSMSLQCSTYFPQILAF